MLIDHLDSIVHGFCPGALHEFEDDCIDLTVTSPPYDNLRSYQSCYDFEITAKHLYRMTKPGGVLVWVVADAVIKGSETLTSMKHAIFFKEQCGFLLHDTMIYGKNNPMPLNHNRYEQAWEYMFVFSKGRPKLFSPITVPVKIKRNITTDDHHENNYKRGNSRRGHRTDKTKNNIWMYSIGCGHSTKDKIAFQHPAIFPESLAEDHIVSWTAEGDVVFDPFCGSGTTCKAAKKLGRHFIGIDCDEKYAEISRCRIKMLDAPEIPG